MLSFEGRRKYGVFDTDRLFHWRGTRRGSVCLVQEVRTMHVLCIVIHEVKRVREAFLALPSCKWFGNFFVYSRKKTWDYFSTHARAEHEQATARDVLKRLYHKEDKHL